MYAFDASQRNAKYRAIGRNLLESVKLFQVSTRDANALNAKIREIGHLTLGQRLRVINNVSRLKEAAKEFGHFTPPDDLNELDAQTVMGSAVYFALAKTMQWSDLTPDLRENIQQKLLYQLPDNAFGKGDFPLATTYGVEIEYYGLSAEQYRFVAEMADKLNTGWLASKDSTIQPDDGTSSMELISPICHQGDILDIYYAALVLEALGGKTNKSCAFHVHAGIENTFDQSAHEGLCKQILINYLEVERPLPRGGERPDPLVRRAGDLDRVRDGLGDRQPSEAPDALLERLALDVLEDDVRHPVVLARVDDLDDVRVVELRDRPRLAPEALELVGVVGDVAVHELHRDLALQDRVERPVDRGHAAGPDLGVEAVPAALARPDVRAHGC